MKNLVIIDRSLDVLQFVEYGGMEGGKMVACGGGGK